MDSDCRFPCFFFLYTSFAGRNFKMMNVAPYGRLNAAGEGFKDTFYLVVFVVARGADVQVHAGSIAQALEEMEKHLGGHLADL